MMPADQLRPDVAALKENGDLAALRCALRHPDSAIRARAADALAQLGDDPSAGLIRRMLRTDRDDHAREEAAVALGRVGNSQALGDLIAALEQDRSEHVREEAALALGQLGDPRAIDPLLRAMNDRHTMVHRAAAEALERLGPEALARLVALAEGPRTRTADAARVALQALEDLRPRPHQRLGLNP